jgi:addiction module HigA family antidote
MTSGAFVLYGELRDQSSLKLSTITDRQKNMATNKMRAIHPGEILREEYLAPLGMSAHALSMALHVPAPRIHDIVRERRAITPDTALRLARFFNTTAQFWLNLQSSFDLKQAENNLGKLIQQEIRPLSKRAA